MTNQEKFEEVFGQCIHGDYNLDHDGRAFGIDKIGSCSHAHRETYTEWLRAEYKNPAERKAVKNVKEAIENMIKELEKSLEMLEGIN